MRHRNTEYFFGSVDVDFKFKLINFINLCTAKFACVVTRMFTCVVLCQKKTELCLSLMPSSNIRSIYGRTRVCLGRQWPTVADYRGSDYWHCIIGAGDFNLDNALRRLGWNILQLRCSTGRRGGVQCGVVWCGVVWCGVVQCGVVGCGVAQRSVVQWVWCSVAQCSMVQRSA